MKNSYRKKFIGKIKVSEYDEKQYKKHSYGELLWDIEQSQLLDFLREFKQNHSEIRYLDFAAGTGRIISFLEKHVNAAIGIEISADMAEIAKEKIDLGHILCVDITENSCPIEGKYDLITAFRFYLNAEPELQRKTLKSLVLRLKDESSRIIFNNHGNFWSHKLLMWPFHSLFGRRKGVSFQGNYMTLRQAEDLADESGLVIEKVFGCGLLSSKARYFLPFKLLSNIEKCFSRASFLSRFGVNQMYIARLKKEIPSK